jgi:UDP-3-O-[3-hydroxymyristoyl] glucosamine N-acyltransferase
VASQRTDGWALRYGLSAWSRRLRTGSGNGSATKSRQVSGRDGRATNAALCREVEVGREAAVAREAAVRREAALCRGVAVAREAAVGREAALFPGVAVGREAAVRRGVSFR